MATQSSHTVAVVGDVNLDVSFPLPLAEFGRSEGDMFFETPMTLAVGGTGASFAREASAMFAAVHLFGRTGNDLVADMIGALLEEAMGSCGELHISRDLDRPSRIVVVARDEVRNRRLMVPRENTSNSNLSLDDLAPLTNGDVVADIVLFDGYGCLDEPSRGSILGTMKSLRSSPGLTAFDLVPHNVDVTWSTQDLGEILQHTDIVVSESQTLARFLSKSVPFENTTAGAVDVASRSRDVFGPKTFLLRYGVGNIDQTTIVWPDGSHRSSFTGYAEVADPAGFGDRLTASEFVEVLSVLGRGPIRADKQ